MFNIKKKGFTLFSKEPKGNNLLKKGFTLVEFVIVMAIIGILVLMATPKFMNYVDKAHETKMINNIAVAQKQALAMIVDGTPLGRYNRPNGYEGIKRDDFEDLLGYRISYSTKGENISLEDSEIEFFPISNKIAYELGEEFTEGTLYLSNEDNLYFISNEFIADAIETTNNGLKVYKGTVVGLDKDQDVLILPEKVMYKDEEYPIKRIGESAFEDRELNGLSMINATHLEYIGPKAFKNIKTNTNIPITKSVKVIADEAFYGASGGLLEIVNDSTLEKIGVSAFENSNIKGGITLPSNVSTIEDFAFTNSNFNSIDLSQTKVEKLSNNTFANSSKLKTIILPNNLTSIGNNNFEGTIIETIKIPKSVKKVGENNFKNTERLKTVELSKELNNNTFKTENFDNIDEINFK